MDIRQLRYFLGVLEAKSFTRAADILHVAQPAIGMQIRSLEEELGVKLLVRHSRGVVPTEAGEELAKDARTLVGNFDRVRQKIIDLGSKPSGRVSVGMTETVMHMLATALLRACRQKYPAVSLNFAEGMSERLSEWMTLDRLDLALTYNPPEESDLAIEVLATETLYFAVPAEHGESGRTEITLREALKYDLVLTSRASLFRTRVEQAAEANHLTLRIACEADSPAMIKELVRGGMGCSIVPYGGVRPEVEDGRILVFRIVDPEIKRTLHLVASKKRLGSKAVRLVRDEIRAIVGELAASGVAGWAPPETRS